MKRWKSGPLLFGKIHVEVEGSLAVERTHDIADQIEEKLRRHFAEIEAVTIHTLHPTMTQEEA